MLVLSHNLSNKIKLAPSIVLFVPFLNLILQVFQYFISVLLPELILPWVIDVSFEFTRQTLALLKIHRLAEASPDLLHGLQFYQTLTRLRTQYQLLSLALSSSLFIIWILFWTASSTGWWKKGRRLEPTFRETGQTTDRFHRLMLCLWQ